MRYCLLLLGFLFSVTHSFAQPTVVKRLSRDSVEVGDSALLTFRVLTSKGAEIYLPDMQDTLGGGIELYAPPYLDTVQYDDQAYIGEWHLPIVSYDTGWRAIPGIPLLVMYSGRVDTLQTDPTMLYVSYVPLDESVGELADIRAPESQSITLRELLPWILGALGLVLLALGVYFWLRYRRRRKGEPILAPKDRRPPEEIALAILRELNEQEAWRTHSAKYYYTGITDALRAYLDAVWMLNTQEETTTEILHHLQHTTSCTPEHLRMIHQLLMRADGVKFARFEPTEAEARSDGAMTIRLVEDIAQQHRQQSAESTERSAATIPTEDTPAN